MSATEIQIATISNDLTAYRAMRESMSAAGFSEERCRFTLFDNSQGNRFDPFAVLRDLPGSGKETYIVLCHQDLVFGPQSTFERLLANLDRLNQIDPRWAVAGNAGNSPQGEALLHLNDPNGRWRTIGLPRQVRSLDENFLVMRRNGYVMPSPELSGFHFYATDLCINAFLQNRTAYVIDLPLTHLSAGNTTSDAYLNALQHFKQSCRRRLFFGQIATPSTFFCIIPGGLLGRIVLWLGLRRFLLKRGWSMIPRHPRTSRKA